MSRTFLEQKTSYGKYTRNETTTNLTYGGVLINDGTRRILGAFDWYFMEAVSTDTTVAQQQAYTLPTDLQKFRTVTIQTGSTRYTVDSAPDREFWDSINQQEYFSDIPEYYIIQGDEVLFYPTPSSTGNEITFNYKQKVVDLVANGDVSIMPDGYEMLPVFEAVYDYYLGQEEKQTEADRFKLRVDEGKIAMKEEYGSKEQNPGVTMVPEDRVNPNLRVTL